MKFLVIVDSNGPLAGSKLRLFSHATIEKEEGWNHEQSFVPFGMGLFVWKKRKAESPVQLRQA